MPALKTIIAVLLLAAPIYGQSVSVPRAQVNDASPVLLIKPSGQVVAYGRLAASDAARGTALISAVDAAAANDTIRVGPGTFACGTTPLVLDVNGVTLVGSGPATIIDFSISNVGGIAIRLYADDLTLADFTTTPDFQGVGYSTAAADYPAAHAADRFAIRNVDVKAALDALMFWSANTAANGVVQNCRFIQNGTADTNFMIDLNLAAGGDVVFDSCVVTGVTGQVGPFNVDGSGGAVLLRGCTINNGGADFGLTQSASATLTVADTVYDAATATGTITQANAFGVAPSAFTISLLDDAAATNWRSTLGVAIGSNVQAFDASLSAIAGASNAANTLNYWTATDTVTALPFTAAARTLVNTKLLIVVVTAPGAATSTGDGKVKIPVPAELNGANVTSVVATVATPGTTGTTNVDVDRFRAGAGVDVCTQNAVIDTLEYSSATGTAATINATNDDLATGDFLYINVDAVHTTPAQDLSVTIGVTFP